MAKIPQAGQTYTTQQAPVTRGNLRIDALAPGLMQAAQNWNQAKVIQNDQKAQLSKSQVENATWKMEDWFNKFTREMNNPQKLRETFSASPFQSVMGGLTDDMDLYDSSNGQTVYFRSLDVAGMAIEDENVRADWLTQMKMNWEKIEPEYIAQADAWMQMEAKGIEAENLEQLWNAGYGTSSIEFNSKLDSMWRMGQWGSDPYESLEAMNAYKGAFAKAEHRAALGELYRQEFMPFAQNGKSEAELNIIINGVQSAMFEANKLPPEERQAYIDGFVEQNKNLSPEEKKRMSGTMSAIMQGQGSLNQEELDEVKNEYLTMAKNYTALYEEKVEEGRQVYVDNKWAMISRIEFEKDLTAGERTQLAQDMINSLNYEFNKVLPDYETGVNDLPSVGLGITDGDETLKMIKHLSGIVQRGGNESAGTIEGNITAQGFVSTPGMSQVTRENGITDLYRNEQINHSTYKSALGKIQTNGNNPVYTSAQKRLSSIAMENEWDTTTLASAQSQLDDVATVSAGLSAAETAVAMDKAIDNFADQNGDVAAMMQAWQSNSFNFWDAKVIDPAVGRTRFDSGDALATFQTYVEQGQMTGWMGSDPEMFAEYTSKVSVYFQEGVQKGAITNFDLSNVQMNANGEPMVISNLVDDWGNALIAVPTIEQEDGLTGHVRVRVFQPTIGNKNFFSGQKQLQYVEVTGARDGYFVTASDADGRQVDPIAFQDETGKIAVGYSQQIMTYEGFYTDTYDEETNTLFRDYQMESISNDPNFMKGSFRVR